MDDTEKPGDALLDDVVASKSSHAKPGYSMPTITAILPEYTNAESEHLYHAFNQGSYTSLQTLPEHLRCHEVRGPALDPAPTILGPGRGALAGLWIGIGHRHYVRPSWLALGWTASASRPVAKSLVFAEPGAPGWVDRSIACGRR